MKNPFKELTGLTGKKRYLVFGFLAVELMSLPAAAQIVHKAAFEVRPIVTAVEIPSSEVGVSRYLVKSNAGFTVKADGIIGDVETKVQVSGNMRGGSRFGDAAQLPGPGSTCTQASGLISDVYIADRKTAGSPGTAPEQAVIFEFNYNPAANLDFDFVAGADSTAVLSPCSGAAI